MRFTHEPDEYLKNYKEYDALDEIKFLPEQSKEEVIGKLKEISFRKKEIAQKQNDIISEYIEPFENGTKTLDADDAEMLHAFLRSLAPKGTVTFEVSVALRLCRILYSYYHGINDREHTIQILAIGTNAEMRLSIRQSKKGFLEFPKLSEEYLPVFEELTPDEQNDLFNAYSYCIYTTDKENYKKIPQLYPKMYENIISCVRIAGDRARIKQIMYIHFGNVCSIVGDIIRANADESNHGRPPVADIDKVMFRKMLDAPLHEIGENADNVIGDPFNTLLIKLHVNAMRYYLEEISFDEMCEENDHIRIPEEPADFKVIFDLLITTYYISNISCFRPYSQEENMRLALNEIDRVMPMVLEMKKQKDDRFSYFILGFLSNVSLFRSASEFYDNVLDFTVFADKALYIHTVMVREISHLLLEHILDEYPEYLNGVCGWDTDHILTHRKEALELMDKCAMCHDIGKHFLIDIVSNSSRRLTEDEFSIIKTHPVNVEIVWAMDFEGSEEHKCLRDCAMLHHRWHNGQGGYPDVPHTKNRPFVDIISIADSLDAATDFIGRPYGKGKNIDDLIGEFLEMGGTRYSMEVAGILSKDEVRNAVNELITEHREEVNYRIYAFNHYK